MSAERAITFQADGATLIGILHLPDNVPRLGLVMVVGGPQYRVGSHRLYLLLARKLAANGVAVLRFDCRGMGDSGGDFSGFQNIGPDIKAAIDVFGSLAPTVSRYVLWGLCDATLSMCECAEGDPRVAGLVLANPWVRTDWTLASTHLRHYYLQRLTDRDFLLKLLSGKFNPFSSATSFFRDLRHAAIHRAPSAPGKKEEQEARNPLAYRMAVSLTRFRGPALLLLSGRDLTAKEFEDAAANNAAWQSLYAAKRMTVRKIDEADHSFSERSCAERIMSWTAEWLSALMQQPPFIDFGCD